MGNPNDLHDQCDIREEYLKRELSKVTDYLFEIERLISTEEEIPKPTATLTRIYEVLVKALPKDEVIPTRCVCPDDSGSCGWCEAYYSVPAESKSKRER